MLSLENAPNGIEIFVKSCQSKERQIKNINHIFFTRNHTLFGLFFCRKYATNYAPSLINCREHNLEKKKCLEINEKNTIYQLTSIEA